MYHRVPGYDENNGGYDDVKFDFKLDQLRSSANLANSSNTFRVWGYFNNRRPFRGEQTVRLIK